MFRNSGGFEFLGRSLDSIRTHIQLEKTKATCQALDLDGLVLIGATHTMTDAALLSEQFLKEGLKTRVIPIPVTVDGNIQHEMFESVVGFDTASKVFSELIGNIMTDAASSIKYWYFIRLMGRDPSHLIMECGL
mmetsp:Transcript_5370/g.3083  ORF Transcript_5370/g.3083 Transcript_5370/m.3083 type:complete len:134 (+) Transcript_5370:1571-1972(+)